MKVGICQVSSLSQPRRVLGLPLENLLAGTGPRRNLLHNTGLVPPRLASFTIPSISLPIRAWGAATRQQGAPTDSSLDDLASRGVNNLVAVLRPFAEA